MRWPLVLRCFPPQCWRQPARVWFLRTDNTRSDSMLGAAARHEPERQRNHRLDRLADAPTRSTVPPDTRAYVYVNQATFVDDYKHRGREADDAWDRRSFGSPPVPASSCVATTWHPDEPGWGRQSAVRPRSRRSSISEPGSAPGRRPGPPGAMDPRGAVPEWVKFMVVDLLRISGLRRVAQTS